MERWWRLSGHHGGAAVILATRRGWPAVRPRGGCRQQNPSHQHTKKILTFTVALYVSLTSIPWWRPEAPSLCALTLDMKQHMVGSRKDA
jgi:hypothetical protein